MKVTFLHPDLGIGGAERLVVDAALALRTKDHDVGFVTNHFSPKHCFIDVLSFNDVKVIGGFPRSIFGKFTALCAYVRMCIAAAYIALYTKPDVVVCDLISMPLLILHFFTKAKLVYYCHFPDQLLTERHSIGKKVYRFVLDNLEAWTTGMAQVIFVNRYTESVFRCTFPSLASRRVEVNAHTQHQNCLFVSAKNLLVLYPSLNTAVFDEHMRTRGEAPLSEIIGRPEITDEGRPHIFLSINRFERKKNVALAIKAFARLRQSLDGDEFSRCLLIVAGGYDPANRENIDHHRELTEIVEREKLHDGVQFCLSPDDDTKLQLFRKCSVVLYTPKNEHFGIVPIEAMYLGKPVIASNTGGPKETIADRETGILCDDSPEAFAEQMLRVVHSPEEFRKMGEAGHRRAVEMFSFESFTEQLNDAILSASALNR